MDFLQHCESASENVAVSGLTECRILLKNHFNNVALFYHTKGTLIMAKFYKYNITLVTQKVVVFLFNYANNLNSSPE